MFQYKTGGGSMHLSKVDFMPLEEGPLLAFKGGGSTTAFQSGTPLSK
jgi:hypothetical protein